MLGLIHPCELNIGTIIPSKSSNVVAPGAVSFPLLPTISHGVRVIIKAGETEFYDNVFSYGWS